MGDYNPNENNDVQQSNQNNDQSQNQQQQYQQSQNNQSQNQQQQYQQPQNDQSQFQQSQYNQNQQQPQYQQPQYGGQSQNQQNNQYQQNQQNPYQQPYNQYQQVRKNDTGMAIGSLICGIISLIFSCCIPGVNLLIGIAGIVLGILVIKNNKDGRTMAIIGIILSALGVLSGVVTLLGCIFLANDKTFWDSFYEGFESSYY